MQRCIALAALLAASAAQTTDVGSGESVTASSSALPTLGQAVDLADPLVVRCFHSEPQDGFFYLKDSADYDRVYGVATPTQYDAVDVTGLVQGYAVDTVERVGNASNFSVRLYQLNDPWPGSLTKNGNELAKLWTANGNLSEFDCDVNSELLSPSSYVHVDFITPIVPYGMIVVGPVARKKTYDLTSFLFQWMAPFSLSVWAFVVFHIFIGGIFLAFLEGKYSSLQDYWRSRTHDGDREATGKHLYDAMAIFNGVGAFEPATGAGRLWAAGYSFVVLLIIASYTANLTSFLVREQERVQIVTGIDSFCGENVPACVGSSSHQDWVTRNYPCINTTLISKQLGYSGLIDAARNGTQCKGVISTDVHMKYTLQDDNTCDMELLGQTLNNGYYGLAWRRDLRTLHMLRAFDYTLVRFFSEGTQSDVINSYFPPDPLAANQCPDNDADKDDEGQLDMLEMSGIFFLGFIFNLLAVIVWAVDRGKAKAAAAAAAAARQLPARFRPSTAAKAATKEVSQVQEGTSEIAASSTDALSRKVEELLQGQAALRELLHEAKAASSGIGADARPHEHHSVRDRSPHHSKRHGSSKELRRAHTAEVHLVGATSTPERAETEHHGRRRRHASSRTASSQGTPFTTSAGATQSQHPRLEI